VDRRSFGGTQLLGAGRPIGLRLSSDYHFWPNRRTFGVGNRSRESDRGYYLLEESLTQAAWILGASPRRQVRLLAAFSNMSERRGYNGHPLVEQVFPPGALPFEHRRSEELLYGVAGDFSSIDDERDPTRGVEGRFGWRYA